MDTGKVLNTVLIIVGVLGAVLLLAFFWNKFREWWNKGEGILSRVGKDQNALSYPAAQYEAWSGQLVTAFMGIGTEEATVYGIFGKLKTDADIKKLIEVFGVRRWGSTFLDNYEYTLVEGIRSELDEQEIAKLNSIIVANGINYSF